MSTLTDTELHEIEIANAAGIRPVIFVHGLWLLSSSWDRWRALFDDTGYASLAPGWPDDPATVEEARNDPEVFAHKMVQQVTDHYLEVIGRLTIEPAIIGHSFGGLIAQKLAGEGVSVGDRLDRQCPVPGRVAAAVLRAQVGRSGSHAPDECGQGGVAHPRTVQLRLGEQSRRRRGQTAVGDLPRSRSGGAAVPGRDRELQPVHRGEGRTRTTPNGDRC